MDNGHPVTKSELEHALAVTKDELKVEIGAVKSELRAEITASNDRLTETMRQIETNLLTEFHRYAKGQSARLHNVEVGEADVKLRLSVLEERVLALETRFPPAALGGA